MTPSLSRSWQRALLILLPLMLWLLWGARATVASMVHTWSHSDTFAHGFAVPLISLWLIWRQRARLLALPPRPELLWLLALLLASLLWLLAELVAVNVVAQFALVAMLVLLLAAVLGSALLRHMMFPLAFLFFAVPFGEFALPQLMEWTAHFTVWALRLSGVPVYQEGLSFVIPSGRWSVVEACSGVRYLIASLVVGSLFAYLNYVSLKRRLAFIAVAFIVPIIANWLRAYLIVMLGHLTDNKLAAGVDHLIYGWLFFGVVIMLMFWIGARWREDAAATPLPAATAPATTASAVTPAATGGSWSLALMALLAVSAAPMSLTWLERVTSSVPPSLAPLTSSAPWQEDAAPFTDWQPRLQPPDALLHQGFVADGQQVMLHVAYFQHQQRERKLISSVNVLVASHDDYWRRLDMQPQQIELMGAPRTLRSVTLQGGSNERLLVWQSYWVGGQWTSSDLVAKLLTAKNMLTGQGDAAAQLVLATTLDEPAAAQVRLGQFLQQLAPALEATLRHARAEP